MMMAASLIGRWMGESEGEDATGRMDLAIGGPAGAETAITPELMPMPWPSRWMGWMKRTSAILTLITPAAPSPCTARIKTSVLKFGDRAQPKDAAVKSANPTR